VAVRRRAPAVGHDHVDQAVSPGGLGPSNEEAVGVAHDRDMTNLVIVRIGDGQFAGRIVGENGDGGHVEGSLEGGQTASSLFGGRGQ
jgi:hypothetical protein